MKLRAFVVLAGVAAMAAGCGSSSPTSPSTTALPTSNTFTASLLPANEVPAVTNAEASGTGTVTVTMAVTRDSASSITAATATFSVSLSGFPAGVTLTGAHIHQARRGGLFGQRQRSIQRLFELRLHD